MPAPWLTVSLVPSYLSRPPFGTALLPACSCIPPRSSIPRILNASSSDTSCRSWVPCPAIFSASRPLRALVHPAVPTLRSRRFPLPSSIVRSLGDLNVTSGKMFDIAARCLLTLAPPRPSETPRGSLFPAALQRRAQPRRPCCPTGQSLWHCCLSFPALVACLGIGYGLRFHRALSRSAPHFSTMCTPNVLTHTSCGFLGVAGPRSDPQELAKTLWTAKRGQEMENEGRW
ncbi:hypothetical protein C8F04DRAFT_1254988 [Mycena alexandri]|uniref:Uncharacterized protein n=1 Tax=Mycena alexandri TaxID=1745969 RepID=A0AAD6T4H5_9AGAR|nr:hypothetical protein C8F04DRAFT_1254988 [Mycena alexandri]